MKKILLIVFAWLLFSSPCWAVTYSRYLANAGSGGSDAKSGEDSGNPWETLSKVQTFINGGGTPVVTGSDTVNVYFNKGDTWTLGSAPNYTAAVAYVSDYGLYVNATGPIVNIDAYGTGAKPIFEGGVTDFSAVPVHDGTNGPLRWNNALHLKRSGCSVKNIKINGMYGSCIVTGTNTTGADEITIESCDITNFGFGAITVSMDSATRNSTFTKNLVHTGGQLYRYNKSGGPANYCAAICTMGWSAKTRIGLGNEVSYNVVYDHAGEGMTIGGSVTKYNIVGDTWSYGIFAMWAQGNASDTTIKYNMVTMKDWDVSNYDYNSYVPKVGQHNGIVLGDEQSGGDNSGATVEAYGNIVINRKYGLMFNSKYQDNGVGEARIFNNTIIDCEVNFVLGNYVAVTQAGYRGVAAGHGFWYNNLSILYNAIAYSLAADWGDPSDLTTYWTIKNNMFYELGGASTDVDVDWRGYDAPATTWWGDPKLAGEEQGSPVDWNGQAGASYWNDITIANCLPESGGSGIDTGKTLGVTFEDTFLTYGADYSLLPDSITATTADQGSEGTGWDIGALISAGVDSSGTVFTQTEGNISESGIVTGGATIILTVEGTTYNAFDNAIRAAIVAGMDSDKAEATGWDILIRDDPASWSATGVVRTSSTVCTITLPASVAYAITANETVTITVPASALANGIAVIAEPTVLISNESEPASGNSQGVFYGSTGIGITYDANGRSVHSQ